MTDWLPDDHLAYFILDVVGELDLRAFYASYREDGRGGAVYDPAVTLAVLLYAYCVGERSSRRIERRLREDVAFRVIAANQQLDHATLARFRRRHAKAMADVFTQVVGLCAAEGLVDTGVVAIDGTKLEANASAWANRTRRQLAEEILAEAEATDRSEDERLGDARGDELPDAWRNRQDRKSRVREALRQLDEQGAADYEAHLAARKAREAELGRKLPGPKPSPQGDKGKERLANPTDPDSRMLRARNRFVQGYNAQAAVSADQVIVAAEVTNASHDSTMFESMVRATESTLTATDAAPPKTFVADTGYWSADNASLTTEADLLITPMPVTRGDTAPDDPRLDERHLWMERVERNEVTITEAAEAMGITHSWMTRLLELRRQGKPDPAVLRKQMLERLAAPDGRQAYALRKVTVEPVFGNIKANLRFRRVSGRGLTLATSEWKLVCTVHNLLKVRNHRMRLA